MKRAPISHLNICAEFEILHYLLTVDIWHDLSFGDRTHVDHKNLIEIQTDNVGIVSNPYCIIS